MTHGKVAGIPKPYAIGIGAIAIIGVIYYARKQSAASAANAANAAAVTTAGASSIDPATGYPYGSAEDSAALSAQGSYQDPTGGVYSGYSGSSGAAYGAYGNEAPGVFSSNAQWAQYVEQYEINTMGANAATVGNAIGKYITGQPLTDDGMISIVQSAIAIGGYPPVNGPNGNPPSYVTAPVPSSVPTTTPTPTSQYHTPGSVSNLQASVSGTTATVRWNAASGQTPEGYAYTLSDLHQVVIKKGTTNSTSISFPGLKHGTTYNFGIQALPGGEGNNVHINV